MSGELSEFEQKSALIPKQAPFAILGGFVLAIILFALISMFAKNEAVDDINKKAAEANAKAEAASTPAPAAGGGEVDDI
jgi:Mg/Co/Ni transporter MgtE